MNIREHIEAGHYPTDDKGRALVPTDKLGVFVILAADLPSDWCIAGYGGDGADIRLCRWNLNGYEFCHGPHLLPPPPRKVKVTRYVVVHRNYVDPNAFATYREANDWAGKNYSRPLGARIVELSGEYEEPWP